MGNINLKKFSIYEFDLKLGNNSNAQMVKVIYKKDDENPSNSKVEIKYQEDGGDSFLIPVDLLVALHDALNEIDPYAFVFSNLEEEK